MNDARLFDCISAIFRHMEFYFLITPRTNQFKITCLSGIWHTLFSIHFLCGIIEIYFLMCQWKGNMNYHVFKEYTIGTWKIWKKCTKILQVCWYFIRFSTVMKFLCSTIWNKFIKTSYANKSAAIFIRYGCITQT